MKDHQHRLFTRREQWIHIIKFTLFSISAGFIQFGLFTLLNEWIELRESIAYLIALVVSVLWNFTLNRQFTFKSAANIPLAMIKVALYYVVFTPLSTWWIYQLVEVHLWNEYLVVGVTMVINFVTEFIYTKYVVYHSQINTAIK